MKPQPAHHLCQLVLMNDATLAIIQQQRRRRRRRQHTRPERHGLYIRVYLREQESMCFPSWTKLVCHVLSSRSTIFRASCSIDICIYACTRAPAPRPLVHILYTCPRESSAATPFIIYAEPRKSGDALVRADSSATSSHRGILYFINRISNTITFIFFFTIFNCFLIQLSPSFLEQTLARSIRTNNTHLAQRYRIASLFYREKKEKKPHHRLPQLYLVYSGTQTQHVIGACACRLTRKWREYGEARKILFLKYIYYQITYVYRLLV